MLQQFLTIKVFGNLSCIAWLQVTGSGGAGNRHLLCQWKEIRKGDKSAAHNAKNLHVILTCHRDQSHSQEPVILLVSIGSCGPACIAGTLRRRLSKIKRELEGHAREEENACSSLLWVPKNSWKRTCEENSFPYERLCTNSEMVNYMKTTCVRVNVYLFQFHTYYNAFSITNLLC